jgi:hypothetical protein
VGDSQANSKISIRWVILFYLALGVVVAAFVVVGTLIGNSCSRKALSSVRAHDTQYLVDLPHKSSSVVYVLHERAENGDDLAIAGLVDAMRVSGEQTRGVALRAVVEMDGRAVPALLAALEHEEDFASLTSYYANDSSICRPSPQAVLILMGELAIDPLVECAKDVNNATMLRARAVQTLGLIQENRAADSVSTLLDTQEWPIRCEAMVALYEIGSNAGVAKARQRLVQEDLANIAERYESFIDLCCYSDVSSLLSSALTKHGTREMAECLINNCSCSQIKQAVEDWAAEHGYSVELDYHEEPAGWLRRIGYYTYKLRAR